MSENRYLTQEIFPSECLGDSIGKHNYNLLSLDTNICNLSSLFFSGVDSYYNVFADFAANSSAFIQMVNLFYNPNRFNTITAAVNTLSSYWNKHEFSIYYPFNLYVDDGTPDNHISINQTDESLISLATAYLNNHYPANEYLQGTLVNVIFFLYNVPLNPNDKNDLITSSVSPYFSYMTRNMFVEYEKQDVHYTNGKSFKFYRDENATWILISKEIGSSTDTESVITKISQAKQQRILVKPPSGRSKLILNINSNTFNYDVFANAINTGLYYTGYSDIVVNILQNVTVGSKSTSQAAIIVSNLFDTGDTVLINNYGYIYGCGGTGGTGQDVGQKLTKINNGNFGGDAINLNFPTTIQNYGTIAGGGGGGAGGVATYSDSTYLTLNRRELVKAGDGGGGGAGYNPGDGGNAGYNSQNSLIPGINYNFTLVNGVNGNSGSISDGGYALTAGIGGQLGKKGSDTGPLSNGVQLPPFGGDAGNYISGYTFAYIPTRGILLGNYR